MINVIFVEKAVQQVDSFNNGRLSDDRQCGSNCVVNLR